MLSFRTFERERGHAQFGELKVGEKVFFLLKERVHDLALQD